MDFQHCIGSCCKTQQYFIQKDSFTDAELQVPVKGVRNTYGLPSGERWGDERGDTIKNRELHKAGTIFIIITVTLQVKA